MRHVKLYTPRGNKLSAGLICFDVEGLKAEEVVKRLLAQRIVASESPYRLSYARLAPSLLNSPEVASVHGGTRDTPSRTDLYLSGNAGRFITALIRFDVGRRFGKEPLTNRFGIT